LPLFRFRDNANMMSAFQAEVQEYMGRIRKRAREKVEEAEEEDKRQRIAESPGGLDPLEVLNSLPDVSSLCVSDGGSPSFIHPLIPTIKDMKKAFEMRDKEMMTEVASTMDPELFSQHLQRCIDSGLWIP
jgi:cell division cycle protein 37